MGEVISLAGARFERDARRSLTRPPKCGKVETSDRVALDREVIEVDIDRIRQSLSRISRLMQELRGNNSEANQ